MDAKTGEINGKRSAYFCVSDIHTYININMYVGKRNLISRTKLDLTESEGGKKRKENMEKKKDSS